MQIVRLPVVVPYAGWSKRETSNKAWQEPTSFRRGRTKDIDTIVDNMQRFFPDLPDTAALARLSGQDAKPVGPPLFLDGLRAFDDYAKCLPLPAGHLDFSSPWTAWRAAVSA
jgi:hypothetical protein